MAEELEGKVDDESNPLELLGNFCLKLSEIYSGKKPEEGPIKYHDIRGYKK